jgi:hypothetical protein
MVTLEECANSVLVQNSNYAIDMKFDTVKKAKDYVYHTIDFAKSHIGKYRDGYKIKYVSNNKFHTFEWNDKIQHVISWTVYYENGEAKYSATITEEK